MTGGSDPDQALRQTGWPGLRGRLFHFYFMLRRPMTLGVRGLVQTMALSLERELAEEGNIVLTAPPVLKSMHFNRRASRRDHVGLYLIEHFRQTAPKLADHEIAEAGFFPLDRLPEGTTPATLRRIAEVFEGQEASAYW